MAMEQKRVGIWLRVSTEDQVKGESLEVHERRARSYAEAKGWEVMEVYRLEAVSGKSVSGHEEAKRMLVDVRRGHITGLIFSKLARLSRNNRELLEFADIFKTCGADLISLAEAIDTSTPAGRLFFGLLASMATWEREEIASRVAASVPIRAKMGKPLGGQAPYGYRYENKQLVIDETEGPIRALLYTLYREHGRKKKVASVLNERGYRTRNGSPWSDTTVERLLRDPTAKGKKRTNYTKQTSSGGAWQLKPESEWVYQDVPALVDEALFDEVVASLDAKKLSGKRQPKTPKHLFGGYTFCACGDGRQKMYVLSGTAKYCCTACKNKIGTDTLEDIFAAELQGFVFSSEEIRQHEKAGEQELEALTQQIETHADLHKKVEGKLSALLELYEAKAIDTRGFKTRYEPLGAQLELLSKELPRLEGRRDALVQSLRSHAAVIAEAEGLSDRWSSLAHEEKRAIVETILERITVGKSDVEIIFALSPGGSLPPTTSLGTDNKKATPPQGFMAAIN